MPVVCASLALLLVFDLARHLVLVLLLVGAAFLSLPWAARRLDATSEPAGRAILLGALLLRLPLLPLPPTLSDDVLRYLWDGRVAASGHNPYLLPPAAPELTPLRDDLWRRLPHRQIPTVYPPFALAAFSIAARLPFPILSWKVLMTGADLAACALLLRLARQLGLPAGRTIWYAWNPMVALEVASHGHVDVLGVAAALAVVSILLARRVPSTEDRRGRAALAGALAALGALAKLAPAAALPMWARQSGRAPLFLASALALLAAAVLPVLTATGGIPPGLVTYGVTWDWNGPLFEPLWRLLAAAGLAGKLASLLDAYKAWRQEWFRFNWIYPYLYPQLLAKAALGLLSLAAVARSWTEKEPAAGSGRLFGILLLASATVYPWYLLWVLPWAALARHPAWLALSGLVLLSYLAPVLGIPLWPWIWLAIWGPFFLLELLLRIASTKRRPWSIA
ncbi:MAG: alpha,6-mannosyltransferase [Acidobacteriota bacterium]|nr:alpha,6-mannosyltransferase [Acidobacteriota bacterium]